MKKRKSKIIYISIAAVTVLLNVIGWNSTAFCDAYIAAVFPIWVNTYGRLTGLAPFSVGEIMLVLGVMLVAAAAVLGVVVLVTKLMGQLAGLHGKAVTEGKPLSLWKMQQGICKFAGRFYSFFAWTFLAVCLVMTLNCFLLYHASAFSETYFGEVEEEYTKEELTALRNFVVEQCNRLSAEMERDEAGNVLYYEDIGDKAIEAMQRLGKIYDRLDGFYPHPKPLAASDFFSQQYMTGYYFPFSMEANYNQVMYILNWPATMCHELAHLRGYIFEDEANFIGYLACIQSGDKFLEYSGYLSVLYYLDNDFYQAVGQDNEAYFAQVHILPQVIEDNVFVTDEEWERINGKALIDTETVDEISDTFTDVTLKINGVEDGMVSYSRVVELLLQYYRK